jgi:hypothetical protein
MRKDIDIEKLIEKRLNMIGKNGLKNSFWSSQDAGPIMLVGFILTMCGVAGLICSFVVPRPVLDPLLLAALLTGISLICLQVKLDSLMQISQLEPKYCKSMLWMVGVSEKAQAYRNRIVGYGLPILSYDLEVCHRLIRAEKKTGVTDTLMKGFQKTTGSYDSFEEAVGVKELLEKRIDVKEISVNSYVEAKKWNSWSTFLSVICVVLAMVVMARMLVFAATRRVPDDDLPWLEFDLPWLDSDLWLPCCRSFEYDFW